jgi:putative Ca2+/H+ antiporter (TMEM165/GDT1 family)
VFIAAAAALVLAAGLGVVVGGFSAHALNPRLVTRLAGVGFILIGAGTLWRG